MTPVAQPAPDYRNAADASLCQLASMFGQAKAQLDLLNEVSEQLDCTTVSREQNANIEAVLERIRFRLLDEMNRMSSVASTMPAHGLQELAAKARIFLGRMKPDTDSELLKLAESICRDLREVEFSTRAEKRPSL